MKPFMYNTFFLCVVCVFFFLSPPNTHAQSDFNVEEMSLKTDPKYPEPNSTTTITLNAYSSLINTAEIRWHIDGKEYLVDQNKRSIDVYIDELGAQKTITANMYGGGNIIRSVTKTVTASLLDVVVESHTTIPDFYQGRALPSTESLVRIIAIPHTKNLSIADHTYKWAINGKVLFGGPIRGKYSAEITLPEFGKALLTVQVFSPGGVTLSEKNILIDTHDPEVHFYEENILHGLTKNTITDLVLSTKEITISAEPYFFDINIFDVAEHRWTLNGKSIEGGHENPNLLTLRQPNSGNGIASIVFGLNNTQKLLQFAQSAFTIRFNGLGN